MKGQRLQVEDKFTYPIKTAHIGNEVTPRLLKPVEHVADYAEMFGIEVESGFIHFRAEK